MLCVDNDNNIYVWDEVYRTNTLIEDIANEIKQKSKDYKIEYTIRDSASKREWIEIAKYWIKTTPADKHSKWENDMSNRRTWIMMINQLFKDWKLFVSSNCVNLIKEFETHYYKENWKKDWEVNKVNDDLLDALRYVIFSFRKQTIRNTSKEKKELNKKLMKIQWVKNNAKFSNL